MFSTRWFKPSGRPGRRRRGLAESSRFWLVGKFCSGSAAHTACCCSVQIAAAGIRLDSIRLQFSKCNNRTAPNIPFRPHRPCACLHRTSSLGSNVSMRSGPVEGLGEKKRLIGAAAISCCQTTFIYIEVLPSNDFSNKVFTFFYYYYFTEYQTLF